MASTIMTLAAFCVLGMTTQLAMAQVFSNFCPQAGLYFNPTDCATFYECVEGRSVPFLKRCGPDNLYNHITQQCDWARNVDCSRNPQPVILSNPIPATVIRPITRRAPVTVSITNPFGRLNINFDACTTIARALSTTLRNQVARFDRNCRQDCIEALPNFVVICNQ